MIYGIVETHVDDDDDLDSRQLSVIDIVCSSWQTNKTDTESNDKQQKEQNRNCFWQDECSRNSMLISFHIS